MSADTVSTYNEAHTHEHTNTAAPQTVAQAAARDGKVDTLVNDAAITEGDVKPRARKPVRSASQRKPRKQQDDAPRFYRTLDEFVEQYIARVYERPTRSGGRLWCADWWMHDEAVARLWALWDIWEYLRVKEPATGMANFFVNYADPMMRELMSETGCFIGCTDDHGHRTKRPHDDAQLPCNPAPKDLLAPRN